MTNLLGRILTRSFPGKHSEAFPVLNPSNESTEQADSADSDRGYESRAFSVWVEELEKAGGKHLVDFGQMQPQNVSFFGQQQMGVSIVGLDCQTELMSQLAAFDAPQLFDAALCWEYPNFVDAKGLGQMGDWLAKNLKPGGVVMLSLAIKTPYAVEAANYRIVDRTHLEWEASRAEVSRTQRFTSGELSKHWPQFSPIRSFLLRSGMQEYVLRRNHEPQSE